MSNLPQDVIEDILVRLPVKSLSRFKCVSKPWLSFISSPNFIKTHLRNSISDPKLSNYVLLFNKSSELKRCSLSSIFHDPVTDAVGMSYPERHPRRDYSVVGSCNGLVCVVSSENNIFLWNPSLRMSKRLPPVGRKLKRIFIYGHGFGYDASNDDYKVVMVSTMSGPHGVIARWVRIYSLKNDSWKTIEDIQGPIEHGPWEYANGKFHVLTSVRGHIVNFDLNNEVYGKVGHPCEGEGKSFSTLGVLNGCLSLVCYGFEWADVDVWVLKEYGAKDCWTKVASVPSVGLARQFFPNILCMLSDGRVLFVCGKTLIIYNPDDNSFSFPQISNCNSIDPAHIYVESLVPLPIRKSRKMKVLK